MELDCAVESPFPFDEADELFPLPSLSSFDLPLPLPHPHPPLISSKDNTDNNPSQKPKNGRRRKSPNKKTDHIDDQNPNEHKKKKIIHRDVERQRRQEMSTHYATLRSLLPLEYLKGKRSMSDHMHEAVKYIQHMQDKIQKLTNKRDELKRHFKDDPDTRTVKTLNSSKRDSVVVKPRLGGFQVVLDTATQHSLPLSILLKSLLAERLEIISCISTKINDRFLHSIESEAADIGTINASELQHKLSNLKYFSLD